MKNDNFDDFIGYVAMVNDDGSKSKPGCLSSFITAVIVIVCTICVFAIVFGD